MKPLLRSGAFFAAMACIPSAASAQLGEAHLGVLVNYGLPNSFGPGAGVVVGVAAGRLTYLGLRWTYQTGETVAALTPTPPVDVTSRVQVFAGDLGILFPVGKFEIVPGASLGWARFAQRVSPSAGGQPVVREHGTKFFGAPSISLQARVAGLLVIPELQYYLAGDPELPQPVSHRGLVSSLRIVVPFEVGRIRH
jgi:hypothetical protein